MQASKNTRILAANLGGRPTREVRAIVARAERLDRRKGFMGCTAGQVARVGRALLAVREGAR